LEKTFVAEDGYQTASIVSKKELARAARVCAAVARVTPDLHGGAKEVTFSFQSRDTRRSAFGHPSFARV